MGTVAAKLTVFFEAPFWIGLLERECAGQYEVCKILFGAEPKECEVYNFLLANWGRLRFSPSMEAQTIDGRYANPKRMQRQIRRQLENAGIGTKAQQALKFQREQGKSACRSRLREQREEEKQRQFELKQKKRKEKHRGH